MNLKQRDRSDAVAVAIDGRAASRWLNRRSRVSGKGQWQGRLGSARLVCFEIIADSIELLAQARTTRTPARSSGGDGFCSTPESVVDAVVLVPAAAAGDERERHKDHGRRRARHRPRISRRAPRHAARRDGSRLRGRRLPPP